MRKELILVRGLKLQNSLGFRNAADPLVRKELILVRGLKLSFRTDEDNAELLGEKGANPRQGIETKKTK